MMQQRTFVKGYGYTHPKSSINRLNDIFISCILIEEEKLGFNGIHDTDSLTAFLYKIKRDFSIKIHHKSDFHRHSSQHLSGSHPEAPVPNIHHHNPDHHTIDFNENVYVEFKPKHDHHLIALPSEATRRPFFQTPRT